MPDCGAAERRKGLSIANSSCRRWESALRPRGWPPVSRPPAWPGDRPPPRDPGQSFAGPRPQDPGHIGRPVGMEERKSTWGSAGSAWIRKLRSTNSRSKKRRRRCRARGDPKASANLGRAGPSAPQVLLRASHISNLAQFPQSSWGESWVRCCRINSSIAKQNRPYCGAKAYTWSSLPTTVDC